MPKGRVRGSSLGPSLQSWRLRAALTCGLDAFHPPRVSNLAASSRSHPLPGPPCSTARVARWEGILPKHSCSPGPPMVAALSACCLPLPWRSRAEKSHEAGGSREIWGFPLSSRHPSLPEAEGGAGYPQPRQDQVSGVVSLLSLVGSHCLSCHTFLTKRISQLLGDAAQTSSTPSAITHFFGQSLPRLVCLWLQDGPPSSWSHR